MTMWINWSSARFSTDRGLSGPRVPQRQHSIFLRAGGQFLLGPSASVYTLLSDISCVAHFYEQHQHVPVVSIIYARHAQERLLSGPGRQRATTIRDD
jgi:hypothetical protein